MMDDGIRISAAFAERIGTGFFILGLMMVPAVSAIHLSLYWLALPLAIAWGGAYARSRARERSKGRNET